VHKEEDMGKINGRKGRRKGEGNYKEAKEGRKGE